MDKRIRKKAEDLARKPRDAGFLSKISYYMITVLLCLGLIILSQGIKNHYMKELTKNAENLAGGYAHSLRKSVEASSVVQQMIHDKLKGISGIITSADRELQNEDLKRLSAQMNVDEISIYVEAQVILSNEEGYMGWVSPEGHSVRDFLDSDLDYYVELMRKNAVTGEFYLYGYERMTDGRIVQVGITAEKVNALLGEFQLNTLLEEMLTHEGVQYVKFISTEGIVLGSSDGEGIGSVLKSQENQTLSSALDIRTFPVVLQEEIYEFREPVFLSEAQAGTLLMGIALDGVRAAITRLVRSMTVVLVMIYLAAVLIIYLLHDKSRKLYELAYTDESTKLPNARYLRRILSYELRQHPRKQLALILVHVPGFSKISMIRGHEQGESILVDVAESISARQLEGISLFRYAEDRFMMLVRSYGKRERLSDIMDSLSRMVPDSGEKHPEKRISTLTFGALELSEAYKDEVKAQRDVLIALNQVKEEGKPYAFFDEVMEKNIIRENELENELRRAISGQHANALFLVYQPLVDAEEERVVGMEALARMRSEKYGMISPLEFIDLAERNGLMRELGRCILDQAMAFQNRLLREGYRIRMSVNISPIQLMQDDFITMMRSILEKTGLDPSFLELEITESVFLGSYEGTNSILKELRAMGFHIAIDDFGTGYSSFARLKELHVDAVKIDQYFIRRITKLDPSELITGDIITMVHKFGLTTVAEGVETREERDYLISEGCDVLQGYYYSRPLTEEDMLRYMDKHRTWTPVTEK